MIRPIRPDEVVQEIPEWVFSIFNTLIKRHFINSIDSAKFSFDQIKSEMVARGFGGSGPSSFQDALDNHWLDVEPHYRKAGWKVEFSKPDYTENPFSPYFIFTHPKRQVIN